MSDIEGMWTQLKETIVASATEVCGTKKRRKPVWLTDDVIMLTEEKAKLFAEWRSSVIRLERLNTKNTGLLKGRVLMPRRMQRGWSGRAREKSWKRRRAVTTLERSTKS